VEIADAGAKLVEWISMPCGSGAKSKPETKYSDPAQDGFENSEGGADIEIRLPAFSWNMLRYK
jgi:hypothetical protein